MARVAPPPEHADKAAGTAGVPIHRTGTRSTRRPAGASGPAVTTAAATTARGHQRHAIAYWAVTAVVVAECAIGGAMDLLRMAPFYPIMIDLGYPSYLATILGTAKILAGVVVLAPGLPRLKEWAYAGIIINMTGAMASHLATHQSIDNLIAPAAFAGLALLSWALRPPARRLRGPARPGPADTSRIRSEPAATEAP